MTDTPKLNKMEYTIPCTREEYDILREGREELVKRNAEGFNEDWKPRVEGVEVTFRYNTSRGIVGIFIKNNGKYELADSGTQMQTKLQTIAKNIVSGSLLEIIRGELSRIRLRGEGEWFD